MWDLLVSIGLNPAHIEKPQSLSSIDSKLKKPRLFKQKPLGRRMGSDGHFQGINLWWGSYFWETCFSAIAKSDDLLYCLLWGHDVVFTTMKLERCFWRRGIWQYNIQLPWKKVLPWYSALKQFDPSLSHKMGQQSGLDPGGSQGCDPADGMCTFEYLR